MNDYLVRGMTMDGFVKMVAIRSTETVRRAAQIHGTTPNATAALGRCLTAASMMGNMQKVENGSMTMQVRGGGPIGTITVVSDADGNVRGCVTEPKVPLVEKYPGKLDVGATVGTDGTLTIIRDLQMKEPYIGSVELISGEIGDDVTAYFVQSEQTPTACALGVLVDRDQSVKVAGGYLVQLLPGAPDEVIDAVEAGRIFWTICPRRWAWPLLLWTTGAVRLSKAVVLPIFAAVCRSMGITPSAAASATPTAVFMRPWPENLTSTAAMAV